MFKKRLLIILLLVVLVLPLITNSAVAKRGPKTGEVYVRLVSQSNTPKNVVGTSDITVSPMNHLAGYVPPCQWPNAAAYALYSTGPGEHNVQFGGSKNWGGDGYCGADECVWQAWAILDSPADWIIWYAVNAPISADISHWCTNGIPTSPGE